MKKNYVKPAMQVVEMAVQELYLSYPLHLR